MKTAQTYGLVLIAGLCLLGLDADAASPLDTNWDGRFGPIGVNGHVNAAVLVGNNLYVAGQFTLAGAVGATNIAKWDGAVWSALGSGLNFAAKALATDGTNVYVGGLFTSAGGLTADRAAKWDGAHWSALGSPTLGTGGSSVNALLYQNGVLYAAGFLPTISGVSVTNVAQWDGTQWHGIGAGLGGTVYSLASDGINLYAGGSSFNNGGSIGHWNGSTWSALSSGLTGDPIITEVAALTMLGTDLIAAGGFRMAGGVHATNIARWNGLQWFALGSGLSGGSFDPAVVALLADGTNLYAAGSFNAAGAVKVNALARWNGSAWSTVGAVGPSGGGLPGGQALALAGDGTNLIVGGSFLSDDYPDYVSAIVWNNLARWDGQQWTGFGDGVGGTGGSDHQVHALKVSGSDVYVGGSLTSVADLHARNIARWDGTHWNLLGPGLTNSTGQGFVSAIETMAGQVYVGGTFSSAGSLSVTNMARWDGTNWFAMGGFGNGISALAFLGADLFAGGQFGKVDNTTVNALARFDGTNWVAVGGGVNGFVSVLQPVGTNLYVGGQFTQAGTVSAVNIARWDGSTWWPLGAGLGQAGGPYDAVEVLAPSPDGLYLYASGQFYSSGSGTNQIYRWDGSTWATIGIADADVSGMAFVGNNLYVGGGFSEVNGVAALRVARWDGTNWFALGDGIPTGLTAVYAMASNGTDVFVGGLFEIAGAKPDERFAIYHTGGTASAPPRLVFVPPAPGSGTLMISWPDTATGFVLETNAGLSNPANWQPFDGAITDTNGQQNVQINTSSGSSFFRLRHP